MRWSENEHFLFGQFLILSLLDFYTSRHIRSNIDFFFFFLNVVIINEKFICVKTWFMIPSTDTNDPYQSCISAFLQETIKVITLGNSRYCVSVCVRACVIFLCYSLLNICVKQKGNSILLTLLCIMPTTSVCVSLYVCVVLDAGCLEAIHYLLTTSCC